MKIDLHLHSEYSWDSEVPIERYITEAEERGFEAISITDHNDVSSHQEIERLQPKTKVILVPGQEINTLDGHLLIYGWIELIPRDLSMEDTILIAKEHAGKQPIVCIAAHPFDKLRSGKGKFVFTTGIDGIETLNASTLLPFYNWQANKNAKKYQMICLGNSDAHRKSEFGHAYSQIPEATNIEGILKNLSQAIPMGKRIGITKKSIRFLRRKLGKMTE